MMILSQYHIFELDTINIYSAVVYKARDVLIFMQANPFRGPLEGVGPENQDLATGDGFARIKIISPSAI
jgi:hypothetical protein